MENEKFAHTRSVFDECKHAGSEVFGLAFSSIKNTPPFATILKYGSLICGLLFAGICSWLFVTSILQIHISKAIISFYLVIGGLMMILGEFQFEWYIRFFNFMGNHFGRGLFYFIMGSLAFAVFGVTGVLSIILMIIGIVVMVLGGLQMAYYFMGEALGDKCKPQETSENISLSTTYGTDNGYEPV